ncbi:XRE family transcriptional regulator [Ralstonia pseudosolanacearum]|uniref:helix-turn-helix domain-containing protein n=1 Tax=Ralstonia pseudosolanacearum TaxID=1310165 RepID=UPI000DAB9C05|nr:helix-turn-helix transcriptional regulator [Ralstonia pseudosolanacearum]MCK4136112.1 helix-turn-helix transcriptional regulator [Ralstonia pseudosolanacearum]RAA04391.1 XRE family transcriptional regulator [Ralstonia pseudosolanacearum]UQY82597.1 helix-turn-helix transcriptional regulator [Ralstonia pseudosolanacearum]
MSQETSDSADEQRLLLAQRLREAREYVGLSQEDVATALGISRPAVTNIEAGARKVEAVELDKLSQLYGQTVQYLLTGETQAADGRLAFLARATHGLSDQDLEELGRFADFLRSSGKSKRRGS